jgi:chromosome segregation ATPase
MTGEIKTKLAQLLEVNRALAHDLDLSHRLVTELGAERDELRERVARLDAEHRSLIVRCRDVEDERDDFRLQLHELTAAMEEIRCRLSELPAHRMSAVLDEEEDAIPLFG